MSRVAALSVLCLSGSVRQRPGQGARAGSALYILPIVSSPALSSPDLLVKARPKTTWPSCDPLRQESHLSCGGSQSGSGSGSAAAGLIGGSPSPRRTRSLTRSLTPPLLSPRGGEEGARERAAGLQSGARSPPVRSSAAGERSAGRERTRAGGSRQLCPNTSAATSVWEKLSISFAYI